MNIEFYEEPHIYTLDGQIAGTTVTRLLAKHGIAPDYSGVTPEFLKPYAERGKAIHSELEAICDMMNFKIPPIAEQTEEGKTFHKYYCEKIDYSSPEQLLGINYKGLTICGTADLIGIMKDGTHFMADHKTTSTIHVRAVTWQTNIYDYMLRHSHNINGTNWNWKGADKFLCFHYLKDGTMEVKELKKIPDEKIEELFDKEINNARDIIQRQGR